eukprot:TRINITY_DN6225_c0_g1_i1.p1 TRINITY_DN6225_c0_g1~~TRINITY_DN6225_c0_g1_i1.p1  ORF type:complete len:106 (+),score=4.73 TRINITY_DN6225_c0_g1_i1:710-1027(+)
MTRLKLFESTAIPNKYTAYDYFTSSFSSSFLFLSMRDFFFSFLSHCTHTNTDFVFSLSNPLHSGIDKTKSEKFDLGSKCLLNGWKYPEPIGSLILRSIQLICQKT